MVMNLQELKWLPVMSHIKAENKFQWVQNCCLDRTSRKPFHHQQQTDKQHHKPEKEWVMAENCGCHEHCGVENPPKYAKNGKNLHSQAKKKISVLSKEQKKLVVGQLQRCFQPQRAKIIDLFKDTPSFTSLVSFEWKGKDFSISMIFFKPHLRYV